MDSLNKLDLLYNQCLFVEYILWETAQASSSLYAVFYVLFVEYEIRKSGKKSTNSFPILALTHVHGCVAGTVSLMTEG